MHFKPLLAISAFALCSSAQAASVTYYLDQSNELSDGFGYVTVTISDSTTVAGDIDFLVATTSAFTQGSNFGIQAFGFNSVGVAIDSSNIIGLDKKWSVGSGNLDGFGNFSVTEDGTGSSRKDPLIFSIHADGDSIATYANPSSGSAGSWVGSGSPFFAAHVAGFISSDPLVTSAYFAGNTTTYVPPSAVPVPAAAWLLGSGLIGLMGTGARKRK